eukprot:763623-Hanusia_phi.AAC.13
MQAHQGRFALLLAWSLLLPAASFVLPPSLPPPLSPTATRRATLFQPSKPSSFRTKLQAGEGREVEDNRPACAHACCATSSALTRGLPDDTNATASERVVRPLGVLGKVGLEKVRLCRGGW